MIIAHLLSLIWEVLCRCYSRLYFVGTTLYQIDEKLINYNRDDQIMNRVVSNKHDLELLREIWSKCSLRIILKKSARKYILPYKKTSFSEHHFCCLVVLWQIIRRKVIPMITIDLSAIMTVENKWFRKKPCTVLCP